MRGELPRGKGPREGPLDHEERHPRGPSMGLDLPERGLVCNVCGDHAKDRRSAERHRERHHPEAAGGVHARG